MGVNLAEPWRGRPGTVLAAFSRHLCRISVYGRENLDVLDRPGPYLIVVNHSTVVDVIVIIGMLHRLGLTVDGPCKGECTHRRHIRPIGTSDMWTYPLANTFCDGSGIIPTDQHDGRSAYRAGLNVLRSNEVVLIYPEGDVKTNAEGSPREWRPGAAALARSGNVTVIPIAHHDSRRLGHGGVKKSIFSALAKYFWIRPKVRVRIGAPITADELRGLAPQDVGGYLEERLTHTWQEAATGVM